MGNGNKVHTRIISIVSKSIKVVVAIVIIAVVVVIVKKIRSKKLSKNNPSPKA